MRYLSYLLVVTLLAGCANSNLKVSNEYRDPIRTIKVISVIPQTSFDVQTYQNKGAFWIGYFMFGVAGGLVAHYAVNKGRDKKTNRATNRIDDIVDVAAINGEFSAAYKRHINDLGWAEVSSFEVRESLSKKELKSTLRKMSEDAVLVINTGYRFSPNLEIVEVDADISLYLDPGVAKQLGKSSESKVAAANVRYQSDYVSESMRSMNSELSKLYMEIAQRQENTDRNLIYELNERDKAIREPYLKKYKSEIKQFKKDKKDEISQVFEEKMSSAKSSEYNLIRQQRKQANLEAKRAIREYSRYKHMNYWLHDDAEALKSQMEVAYNEMGHLVKTFLTHKSIRDDFRRNKEPLFIGVPDPIRTKNHSVSKTIDALKIASSVTDGRSIYMMDPGLSEREYADFYSLINGYPVIRRDKSQRQ